MVSQVELKRGGRVLNGGPVDGYREPEGTIWAIVDGKLREDAPKSDGGGGGGGGDKRPTVACEKPQQIMKLGTSPDFGRCKGQRKDGAPCTMHVNTRVAGGASQTLPGTHVIGCHFTLKKHQ